jgi:hypothetical protein
MTDGAGDGKSPGGATPEARRWAARLDEVRAAAAADRERALAERAERDRRIEREHLNPVAFAFGLLAVMLLLLVGWFVVDRMRCDPFYSNAGLARLHACR